MSRRGQNGRMAPNPPGQDGGLPPCSAKESAQPLFAMTPAKNTPLPSQTAPASIDPDVYPEDIDTSLLLNGWNSQHLPYEYTIYCSQYGASCTTCRLWLWPTFWDILLAVNTGSSCIADLTGEVKRMKTEISLVQQKLRECTSVLKGWLSSMEDEWQPLQWDVCYIQSVSSANAARLEDLENRLRRNNVWAVGQKGRTMWHS